jgi:adenine phosphoribosyltransferase
MLDLGSLIRDVPDFPKKGILFKDITTLLKDPPAFKQAIDQMTDLVRQYQPDVVIGMESRGFIFAAPIAYQLDAGFVPVRKLGKLPGQVISTEYDLEYGTNTLELHNDAIAPGQQVLIVDDLLATGGTVSATIDLVERLGGKVMAVEFLVELVGLNGRDRLQNYDVVSLIKF